MNALTAVYVATPAILAAPAGIAVFSTAETYGIPAVAIEAWTITNWRAVTSAAGWLYNQYQCQIQGNC